MSAPRGKLFWACSLAVASVSSAAVVILWAAPLEAPAIAFGRVLITAGAMMVLGAGQLREGAALLRREPDLLARVCAAGALLALHFGSWIESLAHTTVLRSVAIVSSQPVCAGILGALVGERAPLRLYVGALIAFSGVVVMSWDAGGGLAAELRRGDPLALVGAFSAAGYLLIGRGLRDRLPLTPYLTAIHLVAAALLLAWLLVTGTPWFSAPPGPRSLAAVLFLGLVPGVVGHASSTGPYGTSRCTRSPWWFCSSPSAQLDSPGS